MSKPGATAGAPSSPVGLGARLRALREATQPLITQTAAARVIEATQNKLSRIEAGDGVPTEDEARKLCQAYGATAAETRQLATAADALTARNTSTRTIFRPGGTVSIQRRVRAAEEGAAHIRAFQPTMVLGQLQSDDYARAVFRGHDPAALAERLARTAGIRDDPHRRWTLIETSGALLWNLAGAEAMAAQIDHLSALSERPNIDLRLITHRESVEGLTATHGFHIYDDAAVQIGILTDTTVITNRAKVRQYREQFDRLAELAVGGDVARQHLARLAALYRED